MTNSRVPVSIYEMVKARVSDRGEVRRILKLAYRLAVREVNLNDLRRAKLPPELDLSGAMQTYYGMVGLHRAIVSYFKQGGQPGDGTAYRLAEEYGVCLEDIIWAHVLLRRSGPRLRKLDDRWIQPEAVREVLRLLESATVGVVRKKLRFLAGSDPARNSQADLVADLKSEVLRIVARYDHFTATDREDRFTVKPRHKGVIRLTAQPVHAIYSVEVNGRPLTGWSLSGDRLSLPVSVRVGDSVVVRYSHHLQILNYARSAMSNQALRIIDDRQSAKRRRMTGVMQSDGTYKFHHALSYLHDTVGEGEGRERHEVLADRRRSVEEGAAFQLLLERLEALGPEVGLLARLLSLNIVGEEAEAFDRFCLERRGKDASQLFGTRTYKALCREFSGITPDQWRKFESTLLGQL